MQSFEVSLPSVRLEEEPVQWRRLFARQTGLKRSLVTETLNLHRSHAETCTKDVYVLMRFRHRYR